MNKNKQLAFRFALAASVMTLVGASAFAESRHTNGTESRGDRGRVIRGDRAATAGEGSSRNETRNERPARIEGRDRFEQNGGDRGDRGVRNRDETPAQIDRTEGRGNRGQNDSGDWRGGRGQRDDHQIDRNHRDDESRGRSDSYRQPNRGQRGSYGDSRYGNRQPYYANGRVSRVHRHGNGFQVWISGARYPFFIPEAYYLRHHLRVGLMIQLGGYYNPLGYYDYYDPYDGGYYGGGYGGGYGNSAYSDGRMRGVVESVDYRRDTFVLRNDATGDFVTVLMRGRRDVRPGDYVEVSGNWTRSGLFEAYDAYRVDDDYDRRR